MPRRSAALQSSIAEALRETDCMAQLYCSLLSVAGHILCLHGPGAPPPDHRLLPPIVGALTSHNYRIRLYAQLMLYQV